MRLTLRYAFSTVVISVLLLSGCSNNDGTPVTVQKGIIDLPQSGQTPTSPINLASLGISGADGNACLNGSGAIVGCGVPWAYNGAGDQAEDLTPNQRFTEDTSGCADGDFVITDNLTGLIWLGDANDYNSGDAQSWNVAMNTDSSDTNPNLGGGTNQFSYCGHTDWRMPNRNELLSLVNWSKSSISVWLNDTQGFSNFAPDNYWSSSVYAPNTGLAWIIHMSFGRANADFKGTGAQVLPVRGPIGDQTLGYLNRAERDFEF